VFAFDFFDHHRFEVHVAVGVEGPFAERFRESLRRHTGGI
jgi:hypothetical protein